MTKEVHQDVVSSILRLSRVIRRRPHNQTTNTKRFPGQFRMLRMIDHQPGMTAAKLAEQLDIRPASVSEAIKKLAESNLLEKKQIPEDKRKQGLHVTALGKEMLLQNKAVRQQDIAAVEEILTQDEREMFIGLCEKLIEGLQQRNDAHA